MESLHFHETIYVMFSFLSRDLYRFEKKEENKCSEILRGLKIRFYMSQIELLKIFIPLPKS